MDKNKYNDYTNVAFKYNYDTSFENRNKNYLKKRYDRQCSIELISPRIFRLKFYDYDNNLLSDNTYTPNNNTVVFPLIPEIESKVPVGWLFNYNGVAHVIDAANYESLKQAIKDGAEVIDLFAVYE